jgi:hypothetical protein
MKKLPLFLFSTIVLTLMVGTQALAQNAGDHSNYYVTYFSNANTAGAPDGTLRLINDGTAVTSQVGGHVLNGNVYASIYMFDDSQEMQECCNCVISPDGLLSESIDHNLLNNTLTGRTITRGVIKIISGRNPDPTNVSTVPALRGYMSHVQSLSGENAAYYVTETQLADANLISVEKQDLEITCGFVEYLGSGQGVCSCTQEGSDF